MGTSAVVKITGAADDRTDEEFVVPMAWIWVPERLADV
jgi:hypothetical protein